MIFLLDTHAAIAALNGDADMRCFLRLHAPGDFGLSAIVVHELYYGAFRSRQRDATVRRLQGFRLGVVEFDSEDAVRSGEVRAHLASVGTPIGPLDVLIAGQALSRGLTLVTRDREEFARVPSLVTIDWS
ncbi:MAG: type II toxin-antitoxin system VapC family toxin [Rhodospirillales bacterium]